MITRAATLLLSVLALGLGLAALPRLAGQPSPAPEPGASGPALELAAGDYKAVLAAGGPVRLLFDGGRVIHLAAGEELRLVSRGGAATYLAGGRVISAQIPPRLAGPAPAWRHRQALPPVRFAENFSWDRDQVLEQSTWRVADGTWAHRSLAFSERSANPFSIMALMPAAPRVDHTMAARRNRVDPSGLGMMVRGGRVQRIVEDGPAWRAGLRQGMIVLSVNGEEDYNLNRLSGDSCRVEYQEGRERRTAVLERETLFLNDILRQNPLPGSRPSHRALLTTGEWWWSDYDLAVSLQADGGEAGVLFHYQDEDNYHGFFWGPEGMRLDRVRDGGAKTLAADPRRFVDRQFYRLRLSLGGDRVRAWLDEAELFDCPAAGLACGGIALAGRGGRTFRFDDVSVSSPVPAGAADAAGAADEDGEKKEEDEYLRIVSRDNWMRSWADPEAMWAPAVQAGRDGPSRLRYRDPAPGDFRLELGAALNELALVGAHGRLVFAREGGDHRLAPGAATVSRRGDRILLDGRVVGHLAGWLEFESTAPAAVRIDDRYDTLFRRSPWDWQIIGGRWGTLNRWLCDFRWSWYGGFDELGLAGLSFIRPFAGDFRASLFGSFIMFDQMREVPRDFNLTVCAAPGDLAGGYTMTFDGEGRVRLFRRGEEVASADRAGALAPVFQQSQAHKHWFEIGVERAGPRIAFFAELGAPGRTPTRRPLVAYEDPEPLDGGHLTVWTRQNGFLLARARIVAERWGEPAPPLAPAGRPPPLAVPLLHGNEGLALPLAGQPEGLRVVNPIAGGNFACGVRETLVDLRLTPRLSFEFRADPGARVNFYFENGGRTICLPLTGPTRHEPSPLIPEFVVLEPPPLAPAGGQVTIDLAAVLGPAAIEASPFLRFPRFANLAADESLLLGFAGNGRGAAYEIRGFHFSR